MARRLGPAAVLRSQHLAAAQVPFLPQERLHRGRQVRGGGQAPPMLCSVSTLALVVVISALVADSLAFGTADYIYSWAHPRPQGNSLGGAAFESDLVGYAVGDRGVVVKTTDGGSSWNLVSHFPQFGGDLE